MAPQEPQLLGEFLLAPAALRDFVTLRQFTDIFPRGHRNNPAVADLYRELQRLRDKDIELVRRAIADEVKRSKSLRREYAKERRQLDDVTVAGLDPVALQVEQEVSGHGRNHPHTLASIHSSITEACECIETQLAEIEDENTRVAIEVQEVVGALSDLRHGRFAQPVSGEAIGIEVLATLRNLEAACSPSKG